MAVDPAVALSFRASLAASQPLRQSRRPQGRQGGGDRHHDDRGTSFAAHSIEVLLSALFLMGVHSTFFAPAKHGPPPEVLEETELVGGNALVEMGTFLAILLGTLAAGLLAAAGNRRDRDCIDRRRCDRLRDQPGDPGVASCGTGSAYRLAAVDLGVGQMPRSCARIARGVPVDPRHIVGLCYGALVLAQLPLFAKNVLGGSEQIVTLLLVLFSAGIGVGSLLCERLSGRKVEIGLVPFGSIGLTAFAVDLYFAVPHSPPGVGLSAAQFVALPGSWRVLLDLGRRRVRRLLHRAATHPAAACPAKMSRIGATTS
jgi:hypothetical protein